jgi:hypothetical protein
MATFRMTASAGAVLIVALTASVPTTSQAQGPGAPLELAPGASQARPAPRAINNKNVAKPVAKAAPKAMPKTAARTAPRQNAAAVRPAPKPARANARAAAISVAADRRQTGPHAPLARYAYPQPVIRAAVVPYLAVSRPVLRRGTRQPPVIARGPAVDAPQDRVMRGRDTVSLVGMLPWWRNDRMQSVTYGSAEAESKVLEAAAVWLAANAGAAEDNHSAAETTADEAIAVADAGEVNEIDRAAEPVPPPTSPTFIQSLLALLGGAVAAAAASARLLFA